MNTLSKYALGGMLAAGLSYNANAVVSFTLHDEFSGGQQPVGSLQVDITNSGANAVDLKISSKLFGTEFLSDLYLNFALNPTLLNFGADDPNKVGYNPIPTGESGSFGDDPTISLGSNAFQADGMGRYDIKFAFDIAPPGDRFNNTDTITYHVTGISGLDETDFDLLSSPAGGNGTHKAAAHIQGIGTNANGSGFIAPNGVPDGGATLMLLGSALACIGALRHRFA